MHRYARPPAFSALLALSLSPGWGLAQASPALWADLVQMPVAVTQLELAGVPVAELRVVVPALNVETVPPGLFLETVRAVPFLAYRDREGGDEGLGAYVRALHERGLRGAALADAIHLELRNRGVPAGPRLRNKPGHDVLHRDFLPPGLRSEIRRGRGPRGEGRGPGGGVP